jgi:hypothetical protein
MQHRHEGGGDAGRVVVLHDVAPVHDASCALGQHSLRTLEQSAIIDPPAAANQDRDISATSTTRW